MSRVAGFDFRTIVNQLFHIFKSRANQVVSGTCDGIVLKMHYRWTFMIFMGNFLTVWYKWYNQDEIVCVSHFNAQETGGSNSAPGKMWANYINTCLSYPFVEDENNERKYLLFYRWISWSLLLVAGIYYIPRKLAKNMEHPKTRSLLETLAQHNPRFDGSEIQISDMALKYIHHNMKTHNGLYYKYLFVNIVALIVDLVIFQFLDFLLNGRFIKYGSNAYPFHRDPIYFSDYISQTFPPFAKCEINAPKMLTNSRVETFGCHLTVMELYEKVFLLLWFWLIALTTITIVYILFLLTLHIPIVQQFILRIAKPAIGNEKIRDIVPGVVHNCKIGDVYLLYRIKQHVSHVQFYRMMMALSKEDLYKKADSIIPQSISGGLIDKDPIDKGPPLGLQNPNIRQRKLDPNDNSINNKIMLNMLEADKRQQGQIRNPHQLGNPQQPGHPRQPGHPNQPGHPLQSGHPNQPGHPLQSGHPHQPGHPLQPGHPQHAEHMRRLHQQQLQAQGAHNMPFNPQHGQGIPPGHIMPQHMAGMTQPSHKQHNLAAKQPKQRKRSDLSDLSDLSDTSIIIE